MSSTRFPERGHFDQQHPVDAVSLTCTLVRTKIPLGKDSKGGGLNAGSISYPESSGSSKQDIGGLLSDSLTRDEQIKYRYVLAGSPLTPIEASQFPVGLVEMTALLIGPIERQFGEEIFWKR